MRVYVLNQTSGNTVPLDVTPQTRVDILKDLIQIELDIPSHEQILSFNGKELSNEAATLASVQIADQDLLALQRKLSPTQPTRQQPPQMTPSHYVAPDAGPQRAIEEQIRRQNIDENLEAALEYTPEAFGRVVMLYISCHVNNVHVKAFVDTGAQMSIMSRACAEKCGLMRLVDPRFRGVAMGVGQAPILGRVHLTRVKIGNTFFDVSFCVMDTPHPDLILGLDQLRKFQSHIDLDGNTLQIGPEVVPFLPEKDLFDEWTERQPGRLATSSNTRNHVPFQGQGHRLPTPPTTAITPNVETMDYQPTHPSSANSDSRISENNPLSLLIKMGFSHSDSVRALREAGGNVELAILALT